MEKCLKPFPFFSPFFPRFLQTNKKKQTSPRHYEHKHTDVWQSGIHFFFFIIAMNSYQTWPILKCLA